MESRVCPDAVCVVVVAVNVARTCATEDHVHSFVRQDVWPLSFSYPSVTRHNIVLIEAPDHVRAQIRASVSDACQVSVVHFERLRARPTLRAQGTVDRFVGGDGVLSWITFIFRVPRGPASGGE